VTSALFGIGAVVTLAFATFTTKLNADVASGLLWVGILFASALALPRTFLIEEEQGTGDLLRLVARPHAVFWGKAIYNLLLILVTGALLTGLFVLFTGIEVPDPLLLTASLVGGCASLAGAVTLSGALVAQAANRTALAAAVSTPLVLSVLALGVATSRSAFSPGFVSAWPWAGGSICYAIVLFAIGPWLFAAVWKS
jgi:heme exporter protein B